MVCVVNVKSNEADGQDSSVHSFFYLGCIINSVDGIKKFYHHYFLIKKS